MNLLLTDRLICPRCDAGAGLILLADRVVGRRVIAGRLGCPSCREQYPVVEGTADFVKTAVADEPVQAAEDPTQMAALLGVTEGPAMLLMLGAFEEAAAMIAGLVEDVEVVVARAEVRPRPDREGVSVLRIGERIPMYDGSMRGVVVSAGALHLVAEAVRVCAIAGRIVILGATAQARSALAERGLRVLAERGDVLVAVRDA